VIRLNPRLTWDKLSTVDWDEVHSTVNYVNMNDGYVKLITGAEAGLHNPHSSVRIWLIRADKPMYYCTWIIFSMQPKRKEGQDVHNIQTSHSWQLRVSGDECTVMSRMTLPPRRARTNEFMAHAIDAADVAWRVESGNCRIEYHYLSVIAGAFIKGYVSRVSQVVCVLLLVKEPLK